ncbi:MAG: ABC transporter substrate-binding protein, partial [Chloroflexota bacterium]
QMYDPHRTSHPTAQSIFRHVCEPLFYTDYAGELYGLLAEDTIEYSEDGQRVAIRLRSDIYFHDGTLLDAQAVKSSFERLQHQGVSPLFNEFRNVQIDAHPDQQTVTFHLPAPDYEFVRLVLTNSYAAIVSPRTETSTAPGFVACTGPYQFVPEQYQPNHSLTLARVKTYYTPPHYFTNQGATHIPQLHFIFEADHDQRLNLLTSGEACVLSLNPEHVDEIANNQNFHLYDDVGGITYLGFNFQSPLWQDVRVRQAVALALNKEGFITSNAFRVADTPITTNATGYDAQVASHGYDYDPERSRKLLTETGFDNNEEMVLLIPESRTYRQLATIVQQQLSEVGIQQVRISEVPRSEILTTRQHFDLLLFDYAWESYTALSIFLGTGPRNLLNYPHQDITNYVNKARTTDDATLRQQYLYEAQRTVLEDVIWHPLILRHITTAVDSRCVTGERMAPDQVLVFHDAITTAANSQE